MLSAAGGLVTSLFGEDRLGAAAGQLLQGLPPIVQNVGLANASAVVNTVIALGPAAGDAIPAGSVVSQNADVAQNASAAAIAGGIDLGTGLVATLTGEEEIADVGQIGSSIYRLAAGVGTPVANYGALVSAGLRLAGVDDPRVLVVIQGIVALATGPVGWAGFAVSMLTNYLGMGTKTTNQEFTVREDVDVDADGRADDVIAHRYTYETRTGFLGGQDTWLDSSRFLYEVNGPNLAFLDKVNYKAERDAGESAVRIV